MKKSCEIAQLKIQILKNFYRINNRVGIENFPLVFEKYSNAPNIENNSFSIYFRRYYINLQNLCRIEHKHGKFVS